MQCTKSSVRMQKSASVRSAHFYTERRSVIQRKQEDRLTSLDGDGYKASVMWLSQRRPEGTNVLLQLLGLSVQSLCTYMDSCESKWIMVPRAVSSHTRHQQSRDGPGIGLPAVTPDARLSPKHLQTCLFLPVWWHF